MSVEAVSWAINKAPVGGNVTARMILVSLADKADEYGRDAWKYTSAIADSIRKSDATVFRTLAWLEEIGVIERGDQRLVDHYPEYARPVVWNLRLDLVQEPIERQKRKAAPAVRANRSGTRNRAPERTGERTGKPYLKMRGGFPNPPPGRRKPPLTGARSPLSPVRDITSRNILTPLPLRGISPPTGRPRARRTVTIRRWTRTPGAWRTPSRGCARSSACPPRNRPHATYATRPGSSTGSPPSTAGTGRRRSGPCST